MSENIGLNTDLRSKIEQSFGRSLTDSEFAKITSGIKDKKNTSNDAQTDNSINNTVVYSSTNNKNLQADSDNTATNFDYKKDQLNLFNGDIEIELLGMLLLKKAAERGTINTVASILKPSDFFHKEHQLIFKSILAIYERGTNPDLLTLIEELRSNNELEKVGLNIVLSLGDNAYTTAYAEPYAQKIKEYSDRRQFKEDISNLLKYADSVSSDFPSLLAEAQTKLRNLNASFSRKKAYTSASYFNDFFKVDVDNNKLYADRLTGFSNLDDGGKQIFAPGLYVLGATPACGKTTFAWQLLDQLASLGEYCIFCSYEMSRAEMYTKSLAREFFKRFPNFILTAADIRRGVRPDGFDQVLKKVSNEHGISLFELQDENVDDLLHILSPLCSAKGKSPVVCIDYLQIIPPSNDKRLVTDKQKIDDIVRKLKLFQRDTNTTFIVISSFNRMNYYQQVSFESFKESGNIEYSADVVWALQLDVANQIKIGDLASDTRKKFEEAKKQQPRLIQLKCLKNRQGNNYDVYFHYFSAHDFFKPLEDAPNNKDCNKDCESNSAQSTGVAGM